MSLYTKDNDNLRRKETSPDYLIRRGSQSGVPLQGSMTVREQMIRNKPLEVSSIDNKGARLLWDLIQIEAEKQKLHRI